MGVTAGRHLWGPLYKKQRAWFLVAHQPFKFAGPAVLKLQFLSAGVLQLLTMSSLLDTLPSGLRGDFIPHLSTSCRARVSNRSRLQLITPLELQCNNHKRNNSFS